MLVTTFYKTPDGREFDNLAEAEKHLDYLFQLWLESNPEITVGDFLAVCSTHTDEYYCTEQDVVVNALQKLFVVGVDKSCS